MEYSFQNKTIVEVRKTVEKIREMYKEQNTVKFAVYVLECEPMYDDLEYMQEFLADTAYGIPSEEQLDQKAERMAERQDRDKEIIKQSLEKSEYTYPDHYDLAMHAETTFYVGQTSDLVSRIQQHLGGDGAQFTSVFVPVGVKQVEWFDDRTTAKEREDELADKLSTYTPDDYSKVSHKQNHTNTSGVPDYIFAYSR